MENNPDGYLEREISTDDCSHLHVYLGTVSKAVVKDSKWALPRVHLNGSSENLGLGVGLEHSLDWIWELKGLSSGQKTYQFQMAAKNQRADSKVEGTTPVPTRM